MTDGAPDPLVQALTALVRDGTLTDAQAARVDGRLRAAGVVRAAAQPGAVSAAEVLTYLGGALTTGALTLVVGLSWQQLGPYGQIAVCGVVTLLFAALAVVVGQARIGLFRHRARTVAAVLAALATAGAAITTVQVVDTVGHVPDTASLFTVGAVVAGCGVGAYAAWRGAPSVLVVFVGGLFLLAGVFDLAGTGAHTDTFEALAYFGYGVLGIACGRLLRNPHTPGVLGWLLAAGAAEFLAYETPWLGLLLGVVAVAGTFTLFATTGGWWYAALGVLGALLVPATAVGELWSGRLAALVLLVVGVVLVAAALTLAHRRGRAAG